MESVHGHNVLNLVKDHQETLTHDALLALITDHFGAETLYHTCSAHNLSAQQLIEQFLQKGKLIDSENGIRYQGCCRKCS